MDLDYRALGNAGLWCIGRLQTDADRERVVDGLAGAGGKGGDGKKDISQIVKRLAPRWFVVRDAHTDEGPVLLQPRWAMSYLRGPMTRTELQGALRARKGGSSGNVLPFPAPVKEGASEDHPGPRPAAAR
jgi:hypothetical protein